MRRDEIISNLKGGLIVSCQALPGEPLYIEGDTIMPLMARAAKKSGACAIRTNGVLDVIKIKEETNLPIIGLIKKSYEGFEQYITFTMDEVDALVEAGADIIAIDCTLRKRINGETVEEFIKKIKEIVDTWIDEIIYGLVTVVHIFDPAALILGGGIMSQAYIIEEINKRLKNAVLNSYKDVVVLSAKLGNTAGLMGAAHNAIVHMQRNTYV